MLIKKTPSWYKWVIMGLISLGIIVPQYAQFMLTYWGEAWLRDHNTAPGAIASSLTAITTAPLIAGALLSLVSGVLVDRFGLKKVLVISLAITAVAVFARMRADSYYTMYICMVMIGVTATSFNANQMKLVSRWFPPHQVKIGLGIFIAMSNLSMAVGSGVGALFGSYSSAFSSAAIYTGFVLLLWIIIGRDKPTAAADIHETGGEPSPSVIECLKVVLRSRKVWILAIAVMFFQSSSLSISMFLTSALRESGTVSEALETIMPLVCILASAAGCLFLPKQFEKIPNQKAAFAVCSLFAAAGIAFAWRITNTTIALICLAVLGLITLGLQPVLSSLPLRFPEIGERYAGTAGGFLATLMLGGNVVLPTYVFMPLAKGNFKIFFIIEGAAMLIFTLLTPLLPFTKPVAEKKS